METGQSNSSDVRSKQNLYFNHFLILFYLYNLKIFFANFNFVYLTINKFLILFLNKFVIVLQFYVFEPKSKRIQFNALNSENELLFQCHIQSM
jgi:hypothetical protein